MNEYTIYCTPRQTTKANKLGAPVILWEDFPSITTATGYYLEDTTMFALPTAEQMINWLEEQGFGFELTNVYSSVDYKDKGCIGMYGGIRKETTIMAIDAALEYLSNNK